MDIKTAIKAWEATGRIAWYHPKLHTVSLSGGKAISEKEAIAKIKSVLKINPGKIKPKLGKWIPAKKVRFLGRGVVQIMK